ncbi:MAG: GTPase [Nanoarchaeota archaeon]
MTINAGPEYAHAEKVYSAAKTPEERIAALEEMIKQAPKHKSSEGFVANLKQRLAKFQEKQEKAKKTGKSTKKTIRKEGFQIALVGLPNSGKSFLLSKLTNAKPLISSVAFATKEIGVGTLDYQGIKAQMIDIPSIGSEGFDSGVVNTADLLIIVITKIEDLEKVLPYTTKNKSKKIITITRSDLLDETQLRKLSATIKTKKLDAIPISNLTGFNLIELKDLIIKNMNCIRIYLKEPGKAHTNIPMILPQNSTVKKAAESIYKGFSLRIKEIKVTGPSSKFPNQRVGITHILKDRDILEFHTN